MVRSLLALAAGAGLVTAAAAEPSPDSHWFAEAKFGLFLHWGLYSEAANTWQGRSYHGSSEWLMHRLKIPAADYAKLAGHFDPTGFDAGEWARFAHDAGFRYLVITAKHHEGFAMFGSKVSPFNIVDATPYRADPMIALSAACRAEGIRFGFYYSQFLDWHEANGGGNTWDFKGRKDYAAYYREKSIPQTEELLSRYGPLGLVWFDMPGGLSPAETRSFLQRVRRLQPGCLVSSRIGNGYGDFRDFGDSELPPRPIPPPWEALFTHNDSWGYDRGDTDFKTPAEVVRLLAATAARGGNLILNVGPDGQGRMPPESVADLLEVGRWLKANGESIYGTVASPIPDQPWGVSTLRADAHRLYLHVTQRPRDGRVVVPGFAAHATGAAWLGGAALPWRQSGGDLVVELPAALPDARDAVVAVDFAGTIPSGWTNAPELISRQYPSFALDAARGTLRGRTDTDRFDHSRYFGDWKHDVCTVNLETPEDQIAYALRFLEAGDYRVTLDYACPKESAGQDGVIEIGGQRLSFATAHTGEYDKHEPLLFLHHPIGIVHIGAPGLVPLAIHPLRKGPELFHLRRVVIEPVE